MVTTITSSAPYCSATSSMPARTFAVSPITARRAPPREPAGGGPCWARKHRGRAGWGEKPRALLGGGPGDERALPQQRHRHAARRREPLCLLGGLGGDRPDG